MSIGKRYWRILGVIGFSATLAYATAIESRAASFMAPAFKPASQIAMAALSAAEEPAVMTTPYASFAERFHIAHTPLIAHIIESTFYQAPMFHDLRQYVPAGDAVEGAASTYDPTDPTDRDAGSMQTSSGEIYDPDGWTAAIQIDLRWQFGGVRYGRNYVPTYVLVEAGDKRLVVKINDVGPLRPGRVIDLNSRAMRYFDPTMKIGVLKDVKVTPLVGTNVAVGPVEAWPSEAVQSTEVWGELVPATVQRLALNH